MHRRGTLEQYCLPLFIVHGLLCMQVWHSCCAGLQHQCYTGRHPCGQGYEPRDGLPALLQPRTARGELQGYSHQQRSYMHTAPRAITSLHCTSMRSWLLLCNHTTCQRFQTDCRSQVAKTTGLSSLACRCGFTICSAPCASQTSSRCWEERAMRHSRSSAGPAFLVSRAPLQPSGHDMK
jgi:hypothetical protein